jgi:23S rRNA (adenine2503-C2)-methyltransferase
MILHKTNVMKKPPLFGMSPDEITDVVTHAGLPSYSVNQISGWLYKKNISDIDDMTDLSKKAREFLKNNYILGLTPHVKVSVSTDETKKYLYRAGKSHYIESAWIPEGKRGTLCLSTQIGCKMACAFCMTGKQGFQGNLTAGEILNQVKMLPERENLTNIVYMGMGEPLDNPDEVIKSINILTSPKCFALSPRRITVSTVGIIPVMIRFINECEAHLAVSLHSPFDNERQKIIPVQKIHPVSEIISTLKGFNWKGQRRLSMEYILFKGFNDSTEHVHALSGLLKGLHCRINLIKFHPFPGTNFTETSDMALEEFRDKLNEKNIIATIRSSRGQDIEAACGLLYTMYEKQEGHIE